VGRVDEPFEECTLEPHPGRLVMDPAPGHELGSVVDEPCVAIDVEMRLVEDLDDLVDRCGDRDRVGNLTPADQCVYVVDE
jgi:hypothetical protein